jgi:acyl-CoA synthetase (AMP-forming)/AMP-acid ligase II
MAGELTTIVEYLKYQPFLATIPLALGALAYLDARFRISLDLHSIGLFVGAKVLGAIKERRDNASSWYNLEYWAEKSPNHTFLIFEGKRYSYRDTYDLSIKYGTWLKQRFGLKKGDIVGMDFMNSDVMIFVWFGLWSIGANPAFINYNLMGQVLLHCIKTSGARVLLVDPEVYATMDQDTTSALSGVVELVPFTSNIISQIDQTLGKREPNEQRSGFLMRDLAILIFTSGTTGHPKAAVTSWLKTSIAALGVGKMMGIKRDDVFYTCMPLYHASAAVLGCCLCLASGSTFALGKQFKRATFWKEVKDSEATIIQYVGESLRYLMTSPPSPQDKEHRVRMAFGNGLRPDVWPLFKERFGIQTICEFYAATEGPGLFINKSSNNFGEGALGVGGALRHLLQRNVNLIVEFDIEKDELIRDQKTGFCIPAKAGQPGELLFKLQEKDIEANFQGYFGNSGATNKKVLRNVLSKGDAYFSSGDIMKRDEEGRWFFCDRIGDSYRWRSENVSTTEVAEVLSLRRDLVDEVNVYGVLVPGYEGRAGCASVLLAPQEQSRFEAEGKIGSNVLNGLATHATKNLPKYAVPVFLRVSKDEASIQRTGTNKQQKHGLREEGIDPSKTVGSGDLIFWLPQGASEYRPFGDDQWQSLTAGKARL